ncbi:MAG: efflux RND transporter periplasmic adaptor subunit [Xanthomonadaceae bacterium]|nr:efflux RND transporter periplasmic adaptor subunit [Xanthomonadaceae bacterium]MDP2186905.1 efflux RND transporter periplasmic adaptor subunit [Xanthomonadales bacterium]MDZ4115904.1 efflux RND transporter periplasmic adaptor subunit [Xanthomonadaceae bacterium]MDZ4377831.1 efflux RND transporter periplasmic adaptor subunit [Xanthomonadaceae bacterium]
MTTHNSFRHLILVAVIAATSLLVACSGGAKVDAAKAENADKEADTAIPVEIARAARRPMSASYAATASLKAVREAQVVSMTSGVLLKLMAEEGDTVKAGDVLARLDPDRKGLALAQSEAQLKKLESEYKRSLELFERQLVSADAHGKIRSDLDVQRAAVQIARLELSYTSITAPISGVIAQRMVKVGNLIQPNTPMFTVVDSSSLEAVLNVPEREFSTMRAGLPVTMQVDALPGRTFAGRVDRVSPVIDAGSGTFRVTAAFDGVRQLQPGMFGRIELVYDQRADALSIPRDALIEGDGETAVFVLRENKAVRTPVQVGFINGAYAEIREGLVEGDGVVTVGKVTLRDGATVEVVNGADDASAVAAKGSATTAAKQ